MTRVGPRLRIIRRFGTQLPGLTRKDGQKRAFPPGQHGPSESVARQVSTAVS